MQKIFAEWRWKIRMSHKRITPNNLSLLTSSQPFSFLEKGYVVPPSGKERGIRG
jgi:hypothetical protein